MVEIAAVQGQANATLIAGYGFTGILVSFIARHHPLGIIPAGGPVRRAERFRRQSCSAICNVPDASVQVLMGIIFVTILLFETFTAGFARVSARARSGRRCATDERFRLQTSDYWGGLAVAVFGGAIRVGTPFLFVSLGECMTEKVGPRQPRPGRDAGDGRDDRLRRQLPDRLALARRSPWLACGGRASACSARCTR